MGYKASIIRKIVRLKIALLVVTLIAISGILYWISGESSHPILGNPARLNRELLSIDKENAYLLFRVDSLENANNILMQESDDNSGIFFEVQIGAFENFDIKKYKENLKKLNYTRVNGVNYITLGKFRDFEDAEQFNKDIRKLGIRDAFIVSKLDGKRMKVYSKK